MLKRRRAGVCNVVMRSTFSGVRWPSPVEAVQGARAVDRLRKRKTVWLGRLLRHFLFLGACHCQTPVLDRPGRTGSARPAGWGDEPAACGAREPGDAGWGPRGLRWGVRGSLRAAARSPRPWLFAGAAVARNRVLRLGLSRGLGVTLANSSKQFSWPIVLVRL